MEAPDGPQKPDDTRDALVQRVARRVRQARKHKGLARRVVSERSGVSPRYLAQLEAGEGNISIVLLERIARALELPIEALIAQKLTVDPEAQRMARLFEKAEADVRADVTRLLSSVPPIIPEDGASA